MFSKEQRVTLNTLSILCYGSTSKWQKLLEGGQFDLVDRIIEDAPVTKYVKDGKGVVRKAENALAVGLITKEQLDSFKSRDVRGRRPTFEEVKAGLERALRFKLLGQMGVQDLTDVVAYEFSTGKDLNNFKLSIGNQSDFDELLGRLSEEQQEKVKSLVVEDASKEKVLVFEACDMLTRIIYANSHPEDASKAYSDLFSQQILQIQSDLRHKRKI